MNKRWKSEFVASIRVSSLRLAGLNRADSGAICGGLPGLDKRRFPPAHCNRDRDNLKRCQSGPHSAKTRAVQPLHTWASSFL